MPTKKQLANLKRGDLSAEEASRIGKLGGIASVKARKERKTIKQGLLDLLSSPQASGESTYQEAMLAAVLRKAMDGDVKAFDSIVAAIGEKAAEKVSVNADVRSNVQAEIKQLPTDSLEQIRAILLKVDKE